MKKATLSKIAASMKPKEYLKRKWKGWPRIERAQPTSGAMKAPPVSYKKGANRCEKAEAEEL